MALQVVGKGEDCTPIAGSPTCRASALQGHAWLLCTTSTGGWQPHSLRIAVVGATAGECFLVLLLLLLLQLLSSWLCCAACWRTARQLCCRYMCTTPACPLSWLTP
jgi:hypothetical protein